MSLGKFGTLDRLVASASVSGPRPLGHQDSRIARPHKMPASAPPTWDRLAMATKDTKSCCKDNPAFVKFFGLAPASESEPIALMHSSSTCAFSFNYVSMVHRIWRLAKRVGASLSTASAVPLRPPILFHEPQVPAAGGHFGGHSLSPDICLGENEDCWEKMVGDEGQHKPQAAFPKRTAFGQRSAQRSFPSTERSSDPTYVANSGDATAAHLSLNSS